jgi:PAS domain S-box-containing protein
MPHLAAIVSWGVTLGVAPAVARWLRARRGPARQSEEFRVAFQTTPDAMCLVRLDDGITVAVNEGYCRLSGWSQDEVVGHTSLELGIWADPGERIALYEALRTTGVVDQLEVRFVHKTGAQFYAAVSARVFAAGGEKLFLTVARDITERKRAEAEKEQAEEALRASERRFRALIEHSSDGICLLSADGIVRYLSPAGAQLLGRGRLTDLLHPDDARLIQQRLAEASARPSVPVVAQARVRSGDAHRPVELVFTNLLDESAVRGIVLNVRDLSERKQMEARLLAADRMVSVGTMAAGVAHEINNPLAYVISNLDLIAEAKPFGDERLAESLRAARDGAERVRLIVRDLKTFSRADETRHGPVDVHQVLDASVGMAWNEIRHRARLVRSYDRQLPKVLGNEGRLGQVVLNLLVNAAQALPVGDVAANEIVLRTASAGERVVIEVQDSGPGMTPPQLARLFEPFFTTKPVGVGTGLGLYICRQIVESMGGSISVDSTPGNGTTFRVELPVGRSAPAEAPKDAAPQPRPQGALRILAVDDEVLIGRTLRQALAPHEVTSLSSGADALARIRTGERFDLILCDLMMPHVTGMDVYEALEREAPDQARRVIFLTGGAFTMRAHAFLDRVPNPRVEKPFQLDALRALLADHLRAVEAS